MSEEYINGTKNSDEKVVINVAIPADVLADLDAVVEITGRTASDIISTELREYFVHFQNDEGAITPRPAILLSGVTEYELKVAEVEGREIQVTESPCVVLAEYSMFGNPYCRIWDTKNGNLANVPAVCVRVTGGFSPTFGES